MDFVCDRYNADNVFRRFKVVEFPISFVGLSTTRYLNVETDLERSAYLKTMCEGKLVKFDEAREISPSHRAFSITQISDFVIEITFNPKNECISKAKRLKLLDNRFVFDLRLIQIDGTRYCNIEYHSEIGRYYISGQYEYCELSHQPHVIDFGDVVLNTKTTKYVRIRNQSNLIATKISYIRVTGFDVVPQEFSIPPNSSKRIEITIKPTCLKMKNILMFEIRNPHSMYDDDYYKEFYKDRTDDKTNFLSYIINTKLKVIYGKKTRHVEIESLHKIIEPDIRYTYINDSEIKIHKQRRNEAYEHLAMCKANYAKKPVIEKFTTGAVKCYSNASLKPRREPKDFCRVIVEHIDTYALFDVLFLPFNIDFGRIGLNTYGDQCLTVKNNTKYNILIDLQLDECVLYTEEKFKTHTIKIKPYCEKKVTIFCLGFVEGRYGGTFEYTIDKKFHRKHPYSLSVGNPTLMLPEKCLKFGMTTNESFITSVPVKIYNYFNIPVEFCWEELAPDVPFLIIPLTGNIPEHSSKICDIIYNCKPSKSKVLDIDLVSLPHKVIPVELNIMTRKLSIKFLQPAVMFKDVALNIETIESVKLENASREIATFYVVEPLIPGLKIEPMSGIIRPKAIITFAIIVQISCVLEFSLDVYVKINNKENIVLPISGNVVEPKIYVHPKNIIMARIPCHMIAYIPVTLQNQTALKTLVEVLDTGDDNIFDVYIAQGNEKQRILEFYLEGGQSKTVFIKVCDVFRREYDMYIPFKINKLLGPPDSNSWSTELQHYIGEFESLYENNPKVKLKSINKDISYCRISGVITVPWIQLSVEKFEIDYVPNGKNKIDFTMTNISKYYLHVTIQTSKLYPIFSLDLSTEDNQSIINESNIKFELDRGREAQFTLKFHPKMHGKFISTAILFLDKHMTIPYSNLTFIGRRQVPSMTPSTYRVVFPPCYVGTTIARFITVRLEIASELDLFSCMSKDEPNLRVKFLESEVFEENEKFYTILKVELKVCCEATYSRNILLSINHECGSGCEIEINFCYTYCPLTLHTNFLVKPEDNPYPYFPQSTDTKLYAYMTTCTKFLEKWMFQQGFRRDLYPAIPDTFYAISTSLSSQPVGTKTKGINVSYINYIRRIAGPLMKHVRKVTTLPGVDETFKIVCEIHDTYREIISLMKSRGAGLWSLQAKFLLSYEQYAIYNENVTPKCNADILYTRELLGNVDLFNRLSKQTWLDFILQSYKVFVMDSCFFDCVCVSSQPRDIVQILIDWYNEQIALQHNKLRGKEKPVKKITNITTDLSDGIAIASAILVNCPYLSENFSTLCEIDEEDRMGGIINNACIIIEAMNNLRLYFPIISRDFLNPNFLQMLFLSVHLHVTLPMFKPRDTIKFNPPLLRSSTRYVAVCPASQETLTFSFIILNNTKNNFIIEKAPSGDNGKKMFLSVKYLANFTSEESCVLLVHGYNKTRIFDTYVVFLLNGNVGLLNPIRKYKVTGTLYRPNKVDIYVSSPFSATASYRVYLTDIEPVNPVTFEEVPKPSFYTRRLVLIDDEITLAGLPKETTQEALEHKLYLQLICLSTQVGNSWIWFRSEVGEFFVRVTTQPRWDLPLDTLQTKVQSWPMDPCSCGEACECYRTTVIMIPHRNELMVKALRYALLEHASEIMLNIFDQLIETTTGKMILGMLLEDCGTNMSEVQHILRSEMRYRISSKSLLPRIDRVSLLHHTSSMLPLPVTIPAQDKAEKYSVVFTSECGQDIRTYRILFIEPSFSTSESNS